MSAFSKIVLLLGLLVPAACASVSAETLVKDGHVDDAVAALQNRIKSASNDAQAYNLLCRAYFIVEDWDKGIQACQKATTIEPDNSMYHVWLGRIYGEKADASNFLTAAGLAGKVREQFETAVRLSPNSAEAHTDLAEFYLEAPGIVGGGRDKAEDQAKILDKLDASKAHWVRARVAEKRKDNSAAESEYRSAIQASNNSGNAWLNLALFYRRVGRLDDMENAIQHATSAPSTSPEVLCDSAQTLIRAGRDFPQAIQLLQRCLASTEKAEAAPVPKIHYILGTVLEKQGDKQAAAKEYSAALALAKNFPHAQEALNRVSR